ncbi:MAG: VWA domain-containing protein [Spirochaetes bacterium]|nr:VWA domain-containing protein [Spirochaetota bacterium]
MTQLEFKNPMLLLLLIPWALMLFWFLFRKLYNREAAVAISSEEVVRARQSIRARTYRFLPALRFAALLLLILALSRPGKGVHYSSVKNLGVDIMITMDVSLSMLAEDFQPKNRLTVSKQVIKDFVARRKTDRIGMVVFAGEAYLQCPLTLEHQMIQDIAGEVDFESVHVDGTAIGDAIALATARMMDSKAKSRVILLVTDGMNNRGSIDPETAAKAAAEMGIKIYPVGIGKKGETVPYPSGIPMMKQQIMVDIDEDSLKNIAEITGGKYFNATSSGVMWQNFKDIDRLEKSQVELKQYHEFYDRFQWLLFAAAALFLAEIILRSVVYRKVP